MIARKCPRTYFNLIIENSRLLDMRKSYGYSCCKDLDL